jgi:uncharacterized protein (UPF0333 family)
MLFNKFYSNSKAQVAMEYLIIVGFVATVTLPLIYIFGTHSTEINENIVSNQADYIASKIVDAAESVYYLGESSKITFKTHIPEKVNAITIGNNEVVFYISKLNGFDEVVKYCSVPINGSISASKGIHDIVIESKSDYVWVSN